MLAEILGNAVSPPVGQDVSEDRSDPGCPIAFAEVNPYPRNDQMRKILEPVGMIQVHTTAISELIGLVLRLSCLNTKIAQGSS